MLKIAQFNRWFESKSCVLRAQDAAGSEPVYFTHDSKVPREHLRARALRGSDSWLAASSSAGLIWRGGGSEVGKVEELVKVCSPGDLRGPTAWTNRGYFWSGFVRLDTAANPERKEEDHWHHVCVQIAIPGSTRTLWVVVVVIGKRQVTEFTWIKAVSLGSGPSRVC